MILLMQGFTYIYLLVQKNAFKLRKLLPTNINYYLI